jgi:hypothetical protein
MARLINQVAARDAEFPVPFASKTNQLFFPRHQAERYKAEIQGLEPPDPGPTVTFVDAPTFARELGISRRTLNRRIREALERKAALEQAALAESDK